MYAKDQIMSGLAICVGICETLFEVATTLQTILAKRSILEERISSISEEIKCLQKDLSRWKQKCQDGESLSTIDITETCTNLDNFAGVLDEFLRNVERLPNKYSEHWKGIFLVDVYC